MGVIFDGGVKVSAKVVEEKVAGDKSGRFL